MTTLAAGASSNFFLPWGNYVRVQTTHNQSGRIRFIPQNPESPVPASGSRSFGPLPIDQTFGPYDVAGTVYIDNDALSVGALTYTWFAANALNTTTISVFSSISGAGMTSYMGSPASIGTVVPGIVKTSNLQATYNDLSGTPGNVTINSPRGRIALPAASLTPITVTNSLVTATSSVFLVQENNDINVFGFYTVPAAGSFTVNYGNGTITAPTAIMKLSFLVVN